MTRIREFRKHREPRRLDGVRDRDLYSQILGLVKPWTVVDVDLNASNQEVIVRVESDASHKHSCPECGAACPRHDARERRWRHLDTCQFKTILVAKVPRISCPAHGVKQVAVPWAEPGSRFTALFEGLVIDWLKEASVSAVTRLLRVSWDEASGIMERAVARGVARRPKTVVERIGVDETSFQKRHEYVTVVADLASSNVLHVADGRDSAALNSFYETLSEDAVEAIQCISMDMSKPYISATKHRVPNAEEKICFDRFHVAKLLGDAVDQVRRAENRELRATGDDSLKGSRYALLRGERNQSSADKVVVGILQSMGLKSARAWRFKEMATGLWNYVRHGWAKRAWENWIYRAVRTNLSPIKKAAKTIREHLWGILNAVTKSVSNARLESINARIQKVKRMACGFRNRDRFRMAIMFHLGGLDLHPASLTHTKA